MDCTGGFSWERRKDLESSSFEVSRQSFLCLFLTCEHFLADHFRASSASWDRLDAKCRKNPSTERSGEVEGTSFRRQGNRRGSEGTEVVSLLTPIISPSSTSYSLYSTISHVCTYQSLRHRNRNVGYVSSSSFRRPLLASSS